MGPLMHPPTEFFLFLFLIAPDIQKDTWPRKFRATARLNRKCMESTDKMDDISKHEAGPEAELEPQASPYSVNQEAETGHPSREQPQVHADCFLCESQNSSGVDFIRM